MSDRHRDFQLPDPDPEDIEQAEPPPTFTIGGEEFTVRRRLSAASVRTLYGPTDAPPSLSRIIGFVERCVVPEDRARFVALLEGEAEVPAGLIVEVYTWLGEVYSGRPTQPPADSSAGRSGTST